MTPDPQTEPTVNWKIVYAAVLAWLAIMIVGMRWLMEHYS